MYFLSKQMIQFYCKCKQGYYGLKCSYFKKCGNCHSLQCFNNKCLNCTKGWIGDKCNIKDCSSLNMCGQYGRYISNLGKCLSLNNIRKCHCDIGYDGKYCTQLKCDKTKWCQNGGKNVN